VAGTGGTTEMLTLRNNKVLPVQYMINHRGKIWSISLAGAAAMVAPTAGCAGILAVISEDFLYGNTTTSILTNDYGGLLICGVAAGNLFISVTVTAQVHAATTAIQFDSLSPPTSPPIGQPTPPTPPPSPPPTQPTGLRTGQPTGPDIDGK